MKMGLGHNCGKGPLRVTRQRSLGQRMKVGEGIVGKSGAAA